MLESIITEIFSQFKIISVFENVYCSNVISMIKVICCNIMYISHLILIFCHYFLLLCHMIIMLCDLKIWLMVPRILM